jgi:Na+/H+ antiporter NhaD and related arsenite permeases
MDDVIIFQAIAANVGSMLMPFGNPQNIIIYRESVRNFVLFLKVMFPPFLISSFLLLIIIMLLKTGDFKNKLDEAPYVNMYLFIPNFVLLLIIILAFLLGWPYYIFTLSISISIISMILNEPSNLSKVDVGLILTFILIFYDVNLAREILRITIPRNAIDIYVYSLILSQFISNVPTTVLFGKVANWPALAYGVDIGGNGTLVASLANLIAFRNMRVKDILRFTKFSFLFLFITCIIGALLLMIL